MAPAECSYDRDVVPAVQRIAAFWFRNDADRETKTLDALSVAWEFWCAANERATAFTIARYAVRWVGVGRQFREKQRSVTGPNYRRLNKPQRIGFAALNSLSRTGDDPAEIAALRVDVAAWWEQLTTRQRTILVAFVTGWKTKEIAEQFGVSAARVSQLRRELVEHWHAFTA